MRDHSFSYPRFRWPAAASAIASLLVSVALFLPGGQAAAADVLQPALPRPGAAGAQRGMEAVDARAAVRVEVTVEVLGQLVRFMNPEGYCALGDSGPERTFFDAAERALAPDIRLLYVAAPCAELAQARAGRRRLLDHWVYSDALRRSLVQKVLSSLLAEN